MKDESGEGEYVAGLWGRVEARQRLSILHEQASSQIHRAIMILGFANERED
jgi:hypothetical protein